MMSDANVWDCGGSGDIMSGATVGECSFSGDKRRRVVM